MAISELARQVAQAPVRRSADTAPAEALTARKVHRPHLKDRYQFTPKLPPYTPLPADQLAAAEARSANLTYPVRNIRSAGGYVNEPVSTVVSGTKEEIMAALEQAGWTEADAVSTISGLKTIGTLISDLPHINKHWHFYLLNNYL